MKELFRYENVIFMLDGLRMTIVISIATILLSMISGTILAIVRNNCTGKFNFLSFLISGYIELFRCTPNILWILFLRFFLKGDPVFIGILSFTLFTTPVISEIVRGGLNNIPKGQYEAANAQGFSRIKSYIFIILPQVFKAIIFVLISQMTTIIKDTSYLKVVDIHEFMRNSTIVLGSARGVAQICLLYGFVLFTYFALNMVLSLIVKKYYHRLYT